MLKRAALLLCALSCAALALAQDPPRERLVRYRVGAPLDSRVTPRGPALVFAGGGRDVDAAFRWWRPFLAGGDVVVLRTSGGEGYNDYLHDEIGGCSSVETLLVTSAALARRPEVARALRGAEAVFLAGGDQASYLAAWRDTPVQRELQAAWGRGAVLGGTSAGCAVLGELVFSAARGTIRSDQALADPHGPRVQLRRRFLRLPPLAGIMTDTHFSRRQRLGRLVAFLARAQRAGWAARPVGLGIDEATALVVDPRGKAAVLGRGCVSVVRLLEPGPVRAGEPLSGARVEVTRLSAGHVLELPSARLPWRRVSSSCAPVGSASARGPAENGGSHEPPRHMTADHGSCWPTTVRARRDPTAGDLSDADAPQVGLEARAPCIRRSAACAAKRRRSRRPPSGWRSPR